MSTDKRAIRLLPVTYAMLIFLGMTLLFLFGDREVFRATLFRWGVPVPLVSSPFVDFQNSLAAWECTRIGYDVTVLNPCDREQRVYNYGPIWMAFSFIPLGTDDLWWTGWLLGFLFIASFAFMPAVSRFHEVAVMLAACLAPPVVFAIERANVDIIIFIAVLLVAYLSVKRSLAAYGVVVACAMFKYYPIAMMALALRERRPVFFAVASVTALVLAAYLLAYEDQISRSIAAIPAGTYFTGFISAQNLPWGAASVWPVSAPLVLAVLLLVSALGVSAIVKRSALSDDLPELHKTCFILGSSLIVGCFFLGQSLYYREIMFLFVLPGMLVMGRQSKLALVTSLAIPFLMWEPMFRRIWGGLVDEVSTASVPLWAAREIVWWFVVTVLLASLGRMLLVRPAGSNRATGRRLC